MKNPTMLGKNLTILRLEKGYTQTELSELLGIAQTTYAGYETGRNEPSIDILTHLAELYNTSLDFLAGRYENKIAKDASLSDEVDESILPDEISHIMVATITLDEEVNQNEIEIIQDPEDPLKLIILKQKNKYNRVKKNKPKTKTN